MITTILSVPSLIPMFKMDKLLVDFGANRGIRNMRQYVSNMGVMGAQKEVLQQQATEDAQRQLMAGQPGGAQPGQM